MMFKSTLIQLAGNMGGYHMARLLTRRQPKILMYHRFSEEKKNHEVTAATFEKQLQLIKAHFTPMTLADLAIAQRTNGRAPANAVVITIDDGYRDFYEVAYPRLKHYGVPATFFVTTGFVNGDNWLWPDQVQWLLDNKQSGGFIELAGKQFNLSLGVQQLWWPIVSYFLQIKNEQRLAAMKLLTHACAVVLPKNAPPQYAAVNWSELAEMQAHGMEIGGHTVSHPSLGLSEVSDARAEIFNSYDHITQHLGVRPRTFCYPNGQPLDYSDAVKKAVRESGYIAAVTAYSDRHNTNLDFAWRRFVGCEESFQFNKSVYGVEHIGNILRGTERSTI